MWTYWLSWIVSSMSDLTAMGQYFSFWFPNVPHWLTLKYCPIAVKSDILETIQDNQYVQPMTKPPNGPKCIVLFAFMRALGELLLSNTRFNSFVDIANEYLGPVRVR
jgi:L-asparagine transporter-like permease